MGNNHRNSVKRAPLNRAAWPVIAAFLIAFVVGDLPHSSHAHDASNPCVICVHHSLSAELPTPMAIDDCQVFLGTLPLEAASVDRLFTATHHERAPPANRS